MQDILSQAMGLKRPQILVRAARFGLDDYRREPHLRRCLKIDEAPTPGKALVLLLDIEKQINSVRETNNGDYRAARHIDVLVAIMAEAQSFRATRRSKALPDLVR